MIQPLSKFATLRHTLLVLSVATLAMPACKKEGAIPTSATGRVTDFAEHLPAQAEGAVFVGDLKAMRETLTTVKTEVGTVVPQIEGIQKEITNELGVDILDAASYAQAGIADAGIATAFVKDRIALFVYVNDAQKFDTFFAEKAKKLSGSDAAAKAETINDLQVKLVGDGPKQVAWVHDGKLVIIGLSGPTGESATAAGQFVAGLAKTDKAASMASSESFKRFNKALPGDKYAVTAFGNPVSLAETAPFKEATAEAANDPGAKESIEWYKKNAESLGLGLAQENRELKVTAFFGPSADLAAKVKALSEDVPKSPWTGFASKQTVLGLRTAINALKAYTLVKDTMPAADRAEFEKGLAEGANEIGVNVEQDIINNLTGNFGLFFYGLNMGKAMAAAQNPAAALGAVNVVFGAQFKDKAKLAESFNKILTKMNEKAKERAGEAEFTPLAASDFADGGKTLALPDGAGAIYIVNDMLIYGTAEATPEQLQASIAGKSEKLGDDLGLRFSADAPYNGLYVNFPAINAMLGPMAAMEPRLAILQRLEAASLTADANDQGLMLNLRLRLQPAAAGGGAAAPAQP